MESWSRQFNIYLALAATLGWLCGCMTNKPHGQVSALRVHIESSRDNAGTSEEVTVIRADPVDVNITKLPILTEANVVAAKIIDDPGGFAINIHFDETGTWILEQYTAANTGHHLAIFGQWGEKLANGRARKPNYLSSASATLPHFILNNSNDLSRRLPRTFVFHRSSPGTTGRSSRPGAVSISDRQSLSV
jgi:hypothetical protein